MKEINNKAILKVDKVDCYIRRYRENIKMQEQLEQRRQSTLISNIFKKKII